MYLENTIYHISWDDILGPRDDDSCGETRSRDADCHHKDKNNKSSKLKTLLYQIHIASQTKSPAVTRKKPTVLPLFEAQHPTCNHEKKAISQKCHSSMHTMLTEYCSQKLQLTLA